MTFLRGNEICWGCYFFVFAMLVVSLFYGNSIWSFPLSIFAMALFMQNNCWNRVNVSFSLCSLWCAVSMFCICIFVIMVSCGSWVLSYFKLFLDVHISYMIIVLVWLLVCYFWSLSYLRLVWECAVVVCIVVLLVCCKRVGSMSIFCFYSTAFCKEMYVIFYVMAVVAVGC